MRTIEEQLSDAKAELVTANTAKATAETAATTAKNELTTVQGQLKTANELVAKKDGEILSLQKTNGEQATEITKLKGEIDDKEKSLDTRANAKSREQLKSLGLKPIGEEKNTKDSPGGESLWEQHNAIKDPVARTNFWRENSAAIIAEQNAK